MYLAHIRRAALAAALCVTTASAVAAQERSAEFPTYLQPGFTFTPGVSLGGVWDSNVGLAAGNPTGDQMFLFEPFGQLELVSPRTQLVAGYKGYVRRYMDVEALNSYDQRGHFSLRRLATRRVTVFLNNEFADVPTTDEIQLNGLPFTRTGSKSNRLAAGVESRLTKFTDLNIRYENTWVKFDREAASLSDGWINSVETDLRRRLNERLSVGAEYGIRRADLDQGQRTLWFHDVGGLVTFDAGPHTKLSASGGYSFLNDSLLERAPSGPYLRGEVQHTLDRATLGLSAEKSLVPTFGFGGSSDSEEVRGFVQMPLNRNRLYLQSDALWRRSTPLEVEELELDTIQISNTLGYAVVRWFRLEAFHIFTRQDSVITGGEINRNRAGLQLVVSQPMRIR